MHGGRGIHIYWGLLPFSWLYGVAVRLRNFLFDIGILRSRSFAVPVVAVGNITVGGTGKTPHVEYLAALLQYSFRVAVLSRGYRRKSRGFLEATEQSTYRDIGDEPAQVKARFPGITVAVDANRVRGIETLMAEDSQLDVVLLDDAFQHRYVKPGINILLTDYNRLFLNDLLLPAGRLREPRSAKNRADIVIVTKCPPEQNPMELRVLKRQIGLYPYQQLFFTTLSYGEPYAVFAPGSAGVSPALSEAITFSEENVLLLTAIASPQPLHDYISAKVRSVTPLAFADHHDFSRRDIERINGSLEALPQPRCIITTEKDAARLRHCDGLTQEARDRLFAIPIKIKFLLGQEQRFNETIIGYVRKNSRNSILAKGQNDHKSRDGHRAGHGPRTISFRDN